jgi:FkbM family methyltransferase
LRENLALNPGLRDSVLIETVGLGESAGKLTWEADPRYPFNAWIARDKGWATTGGGVEVDIETLDAVVRRLGLSRVDFVKIDVETMELEVLLGARDTLRTRRPVVPLSRWNGPGVPREGLRHRHLHEIRRLLDSLGIR